MMLELLSTGGFHFSAENALLTQELLDYREDLSSATPSYGGPKRTVSAMIAGELRDLIIKDDALESAMWAMWGLRAQKRPSSPGSFPTKPAAF